MACASSPVPRMKLLEEARLFPIELPRLTLFRLQPSAQMLVSRQFCTRPPFPEAQNPDMVCSVQILSASQLFPVVSIAPPHPSTTARLVASASSAKLRTVQDVTLKIAPSGFALGSGMLR